MEPKGKVQPCEGTEVNRTFQRGEGGMDIPVCKVVKSRDEGVRFGDLKQKVNEKVDENKDLSFSLQFLPTVHVMPEAEFANRCFQTPFC